MAQAGNLSIKVALELAQMRADIAQVSTALDKATAAWSNDLKKFGTTAKGVFAGSFVADAVMRGISAVSAAITATINNVDEMANAAKRASVDFQSWQVIEEVARGASVNVETMTKGVQELNKTLGTINAGGGKKAAEALDRIGLAASDLQKMKVADRLKVVVDALNKVPEPADRAAIGTQLFRKAYDDLVPVIQGGAGAFDEAAARMERFGLAVSDEAAGGIQDFKDAMRTLQDSTSAALAEGLAPFLAALVPLIEYFAEASKNSGLLDASLDVLLITFKGVASVVIAVVAAFKALGIVISTVAKTVGIGIARIATDIGTLADLFTGEIGFGEALDRFRSNSAQAMADLKTTVGQGVDDVVDEAKRAAGAIGDIATSAPKARAAVQDAFTPLPAVIKPAKEAAEKTAKALKDVKTEADRLNETLADAQRELEAAQARAAGASQEEINAILVKGKAYAALELQILETKQSTDAYNSAADQAKDDAKAFADATIEFAIAQRRANGQTEEQILLWRAMAEGWSDARLQAELLGLKMDDLAKKEEDRKKRQDELKEFWTDFGNMAGQAIADVATGTKSASEAMKAFVIQLAAAVVQAQLLKLLGIGSGIPSLGAHAARGAWFDRGGIAQFAQGGIFTGPTAFRFGGGRTGVMGEAGPEAILPLGKVGGRLGVHANASPIEIHNYGAQIDLQQDSDRTRVIVKAVRDQLAGDILRGGNPFSTALERTYPGVRR